MFGTFIDELPDIPITFGLVDQPQTMNMFEKEFFYFRDLWNKAQSMDNWSDWFSTWLKGPGWMPGLSRLGDYSQIPEVLVLYKHFIIS